jgi:hypothetical protein
MNDLDNELRRVLRRKQPPNGFTERVLLQVAANRNRQTAQLSSWSLGWVAACLILSVGIPFSALEYRRTRERRVEGQMAKQQLILAVHVAGRKLNSAQRKVYEISLGGENR